MIQLPKIGQHAQHKEDIRLVEQWEVEPEPQTMDAAAFGNRVIRLLQLVLFQQETQTAFYGRLYLWPGAQMLR